MSEPAWRTVLLDAAVDGYRTAKNYCALGLDGLELGSVAFLENLTKREGGALQMKEQMRRENKMFGVLSMMNIDYSLSFVYVETESNEAGLKHHLSC